LKYLPRRHNTQISQRNTFIRVYIPYHLRRNICNGLCVRSFWLRSKHGDKLKFLRLFQHKTISACVVAVTRQNGVGGLFRTFIHDAYHPGFPWPTKSDSTSVKKATSEISVTPVTCDRFSPNSMLRQLQS
jgi:hypothetical protein